MSFSNLPNEIIFEVVDYLGGQREINSVARASARYHQLLNDHLYRYNIRLEEGKGLWWSAKHGREAAVRRFLHLGADVNASWKIHNSDPGKLHEVTALHMSAAAGHLNIATILLDLGADPYATTKSGRTPLLLALKHEHEDVAQKIFQHTNKSHMFLADTKLWLTPLHVACRFGLSRSVRYFLDNGADIDARDKRGKTPLLQMLKGRTSLRKSTVAHYTDELGPDKFLDVVEILLEFGADPNLVVNRQTRTPNMTARAFAAFHPDRRVRALFGNGDDGSKSTQLSSRQIEGTPVVPSESSSSGGASSTSGQGQKSPLRRLDRWGKPLRETKVSRVAQLITSVSS
jgi:hypothetical protein